MDNVIKADPVDRIRAVMDRKGWNQARMGEYLGVPQGTIANWLGGNRKPSASVVRLLDVLGTVEALAPAIHQTFIPRQDRSN